MTPRPPVPTHTPVRTTEGKSAYDTVGGFKRVIWNCDAKRGPLLVRYHIPKTRWFGIYLHHLMTSDDDRALHDHPWAFIGILLSSGYWEYTPSGKTWHRRFSVLFRPARWQHRLELVKPTWMLVLRGPVCRNWGFILPSGWTDWKTYGREFCD